MSIFKNKKYIFDGGMGQLLIDKGMVSIGTLWSASALINKNLNNLVLDAHMEFISAGAEIIVTNNFKVRKNTFHDNGIDEKFNFANKRAGELALDAKNKSNKEVLIAGSLPTRGVTYQPNQNYSEKVVYDEFFETARELNPFVDFFYLDVLASVQEVKTALSAIKVFNKPALLGLHFKKDFLLPSDETFNTLSREIKNFNCEGIMASCVSPEIYEGVLPSLKENGLPFGFAVNAFIDIPEKIDLNIKFSLQPNDSLGLRKNLTPQFFSNFGFNAFKQGAKFLKGCCNIMPSHINALSVKINKT
jgi:homocysteine S-methyltransferase